VRVIARSTLTKFVETLSGTKQRFAVKAALDAWFHEAGRADWRSPADVRKHYGTASVVDRERVVFNIRGNDYRLVTAIDYGRRTVFIKWLGSHAEYDKINVRNVRYGDQAYQKR
jgi:mRNA interferase HigB